MERISGPVDGYYVVSYACEVGEFGHEFVGYTKLCEERPDTFWDGAGHVVCDDLRFPDADQAMTHSEELALRRTPHAVALTPARASARRAAG